MTNSFFGRSPMDLGPANMYVKPQSVGSWTDNTGWTLLGLTESCIFRSLEGWADLKASQKGDGPWNRVIISQRCQMEANLAEPTLEVLESIDAIYLKRVTAVIKQAMIVKQIGKSHRDNLLWIKQVELQGDKESTNPLDTVYILGARSSETVELVHDAATQRFWSCQFEAYENTDALTQVKDADGNIAYAWTGLIP